MKTTSKLALSLACVGVLTACGSDTTYLLSGNVTGLDGQLTIVAGEEQISVSDNGDINFETDYKSGDSVSVSLMAMPELQSCEITSATSFTFDGDDIDTLAIECRDLELYQAVVDVATTSDDAAVTIDVLANDTSEYAATFEITDVTEPTYGAAVISENQIVYTPNAGFAGTDTFSYTGTDGAQQSSAEVTVTVSQTVTLAGRVTDAPLADATVTVTVNGESYTATTNADGDYLLHLSMDDLSSTSRPRLKAVGAGEQSYITLSSRLPSVGSMMAAAGEDRKLERAESSKVQVTQLTTAEDIILTALAQDEDITDESLPSLMTEFDSELMLEMAATIKLLADNPNYQLPDNHDSIESFLADAEAYNTFVEDASTSGDLQVALEETVNDPEVAESPDEITLASLNGAYIIQGIGSRYSARSTFNYLTVEDGEFVRLDGSPAKISLTQLADGAYEGSSFNSFYSNINTSSLQYYDLKMDAATEAAFIAAIATTPITVNILRREVKFKVLLKTDYSVLVQRTTEEFVEAFSFEHEGATYSVEKQMVYRGTYPQVWLDVDNLPTGAQISVADGERWIVPVPYDANIGTNRTEVPEADVTYLTQMVTMAPKDATSGTWTNILTKETGAYTLSDNATLMTLTATRNAVDYKVTLAYTRNDQYVKEMLGTMTTPGVEGSLPQYNLFRAGPAVATADVDSLKHGANAFHLALLNIRPEQWKETGADLSGSLDTFYGWHLAASGDLNMLDPGCTDAEYDFYENNVCSAAGLYWKKINHSDESWSFTDEFLHFNRSSFISEPDCTGELSCGGRFVYPVSTNADTGITTVIEFELVSKNSPQGMYYPYTFINEGEFVQRSGLHPRINYWFEQPFAGVGVTSGVSAQTLTSKRFVTPLAKYQVINRQRVAPSEQPTTGN